jgi:uncharacterized membrane protein (DUF4010 family)
MDPLMDVFRDLATALFIGALVGTERGWQSEPDKEAILGLRTFTLVAAAGAACALIADVTKAPVIFGAGLLGLVALIIGSYWATVRRNEQAVGLTTEVAAVLVFVLGGAVMFVGPEAPVALAIVATLVLAMKDQLHELIRKLGEDDIFAGLKLLFATFIVLPLLPREAIDPWGALKPWSLWWLVILIASISLVGYVAVRWLGQNRGMAITGLFGGLVSSTAVTLSFARRSKEAVNLSGALAAGVLIAWLTMAGRVLVEVAVVERSLLADLVWPMVGLGLPAAVVAAVVWWKAGKSGNTGAGESGGEDVPLKNPFSLIGAMKFGALFAVVLIAVKLAQAYAPASGIYAVSALAGLTDVDAITLSLAESVGDGDTTAAMAVRGIILASFANTFVKLGLVISLGERRMAKIVGIATVAMVVGAGLALLLLG